MNTESSVKAPVSRLTVTNRRAASGKIVLWFKERRDVTFVARVSWK